MAMPSEEDATAAEQVARSGSEQEEASEGEDVGVQDPREGARREAQALLDVRQGNVDDGGVEYDHQLGGQDHEQEYRRVTQTVPQRARGPGWSWEWRRRGACHKEEMRALTDTFPLVTWQAEASSGYYTEGGSG